MFSINKLVSEYVSSVLKLGVCNEDTLGPFIRDVVQKGYTELKDSLENVIRTVPNDAIIQKIEGIRDSPNTVTMGMLRDISNKVVCSSDLRDIPNDVTVNYLKTLETMATTSDSALKDLASSFTEYTSLFKTGSVKGRNTELKTIMQLDSVFPRHDVIHVPSSKQKGKMDIILSLEGRPDISIDTKTYTKTVPKSEVCKFEGDIALGDTHGIMVSTTSKIIGKPHFTIDIIKGNVAVYLSNVGLDTSCIELAVDIIYSLHKVLEGRNGGISSDTVLRIEDLIREDLKRLDKIRESLNVSLVCVKEMTLSRILELLKV